MLFRPNWSNRTGTVTDRWSNQSVQSNFKTMVMTTIIYVKFGKDIYQGSKNLSCQGCETLSIKLCICQGFLLQFNIIFNKKIKFFNGKQNRICFQIKYGTCLSMIIIMIKLFIFAIYIYVIKTNCFRWIWILKVQIQKPIKVVLIFLYRMKSNIRLYHKFKLKVAYSYTVDGVNIYDSCNHI